MPEYRTENVIGDNIEFERMLDEFLRHMEKFDQKLSLQTQKIILRQSTKDAVKSLRSRTRATYAKRTGRAYKSVKQVVKNSSTRKGIAYTTYGWRNKGIKEIYTKRRNQDGTFRQRPKPATYIGIWNDLGTKHIRGQHILSSEWRNHKEKIKKNIEDAITVILNESLLKK